MKLKVVSEFCDKYTDQLYKIGEDIEVDEARGNELLSSSFSLVEPIEEEKKEKDTEKPKKKRTKKAKE